MLWLHHPQGRSCSLYCKRTLHMPISVLWPQFLFMQCWALVTFHCHDFKRNGGVCSFHPISAISPCAKSRNIPKGRKLYKCTRLYCILRETWALHENRANDVLADYRDTTICMQFIKTLFSIKYPSWIQLICSPFRCSSQRFQLQPFWGPARQIGSNVTAVLSSGTLLHFSMPS